MIPGLASVIVPAYNHEKYVGAAIASVIAQTYRNIELLVLDDGSPDGTWEAIKATEDACRARFVRVEFWRQPNLGVWPTLNSLLDRARGEYVTRLDSDDLMRPNSIQKLQTFLESNPDYGLAVGDNEIIDESGQAVFWTRNRENTTDPDKAAFPSFAAFLKYASEGLDFNSSDFGAYLNLIPKNHVPNGYLIRKSVLEGVKFTSEAPQEDHFMVLQIAKRARLKYLDEVLHSYRWHQHNNIKKRGMWFFARRTMVHELALLKDAGDQEMCRRVRERLTAEKKKSKLRLGDFLEFYRTKTFLDKGRYMLRVGSRVFCLRDRCSYPFDRSDG
ncbi:hypothetical protein FACS1894205_1870 [Alphaproteobacteria bacterium]|nr:hypothetical protein FACS1894205_1870 [Alphaproteobacteria bacterium]